MLFDEVQVNFFHKTRIDFYERKNRRLIYEAFQGARNRKTVSRGDKALSKCRESGSLAAVNPFSRVIWAKALCYEIEKQLCFEDSTDHKRDMFLVTLVDRSCATTIKGTDIDIEAIKRRLRYGLRGLSYLAIIEPAFYTNLKVDPSFQRERRLYWHLHAAVWGITKKKLRQMIRQLNKSGRYVPVVDRLKGAHAKAITQGDLPAVVGYMLKSPGNTYRVFQVDRRGPDGKLLVTSDGEIRARFVQRKGELRKGQRISLFHAMKGLQLDHLAVAGGEGVSMLARAKRIALST
jgi:hypothetical protein